MNMVSRAPCRAQLPHATTHDRHVDAALTREERRRVALASLEIMERRHRLRLAQIAAERRALLAGAKLMLMPQ
jgi:hypothetical protein